MDIKDLKDLILTVNKTDIEKVQMEKGDFKLTITRDKSNKGDHLYTAPIATEVARPTVEEQVAAPQEDENIYTIKSPMVGVYYESSSPDAEAFVQVGSKIEKGQTLCIVEAMKIMNEIEAEVAGEVVEILVANEDIIEYGQDLIRIRRM